MPGHFRQKFQPGLVKQRHQENQHSLRIDRHQGYQRCLRPWVHRSLARNGSYQKFEVCNFNIRIK